MRKFLALTVISIIFLFVPRKISAEVVINEVLPAPSSDVSQAEWIELYNTADQEVNLNGYQLAGKLITQATIPAQGYLVFTANQNQFISKYGEQAPITKQLAFRLSNSGGTIALLDLSGNSLNQITYTDSDRMRDTSWERSNLDNSNFIAHCFSSTPGRVNSNWGFSEQQCPRIQSSIDGTNWTDGGTFYNDQLVWVRPVQIDPPISLSLKIGDLVTTIFPSQIQNPNLSTIELELGVIPVKTLPVNNLVFKASEELPVEDISSQQINSIKDMSTGDEATVFATITSPPGYTAVREFYVQDSSGGLRVSSTVELKGLVIGDKVKLTGKIGSTNSQKYLRLATLDILSRKNKVEIYSLSDDYSLISDNLVRLQGEVTRKYSTSLDISTSEIEQLRLGKLSAIFDKEIEKGEMLSGVGIFLGNTEPMKVLLTEGKKLLAGIGETPVNQVKPTVLPQISRISVKSPILDFHNPDGSHSYTFNFQDISIAILMFLLSAYSLRLWKVWQRNQKVALISKLRSENTLRTEFGLERATLLAGVGSI